MANEKFDGMIKLLSNSSFKFDSIISDDLMCVYCHNVLINAHQAPCGCKFCRHCVDKLIELASEVCPGNTEECKENIFSKHINISVDYRTNNIIFKLKVRCPNEHCNHECDFKSMSSHFEICKQRSISAKMKNGLDSETVSEENELMAIINRLLDSVNQLKNQEESNKMEIDKLKETILNNNSLSVNSVVEIARNEIQKAKNCDGNSSIIKDFSNLQTEDSFQSTIIASLKRELRKRENEIAAVNQEITSIKLAYSDEFKQRMEVYFNDKLASFIKDMKSIYENEMVHVRNGFANTNMSYKTVDKNDGNCKMLGNTKDNKDNIEKEVKTESLVDPYVWYVNESLSNMDRNAVLHSANFFSQDKCYLLRMSLSMNSDVEETRPSEWNIDLSVIDEGCEVGNGFPMNRDDVTINILDQANNSAIMTFNKTCSINKKEKFSMAKFGCSDLISEADLKIDLIAIQCIV